MVDCHSSVDSAPVTHRVGPMFAPSSTAQTCSGCASSTGSATSTAGKLFTAFAASTVTPNASASPAGRRR